MTGKSTPWTCPTCGQSGIADFQPFCSLRCANLDLGKWLDGSYTLPGSERPGLADTDDDGVY